MSESIQPERGCDRIVSYFMGRILSRKLSPGEKLPSEGDLCQQFEVSRTVIREAIQQLKARGAIDTINGKGSYVAENRMNHLQDSLQLFSSRTGGARDWVELLSLRSLIETDCVKTLTENGDPLKLDQIKEALDVMRDNHDDLKKFAEADIEFHHAIVSLSGNRLYAAVWSSLQGLALRFAHDTYQAYGQVQVNLDEHEAIYQAILSGRVDHAGRAMSNHLAHSLKNFKCMSQ